MDHARRAHGQWPCRQGRISVGRYEGRYSKLTLVVHDSDLELLEFNVTFANGQRWTPPGVRHYFREGGRTRVIDLPGDTRIIQHIDLRYRNLPGGGRATVQVWGFKVTAPPPPAPRVMGSNWDSTGWTLLGERTINGRGRVDRDVIPVGRYEGRFSKLTMVAMDSDFEMINFTVRFASGHRGPSPALLREGTRTRVIDSRFDKAIRRVEYNLPGGSRVRCGAETKLYPRLASGGIVRCVGSPGDRHHCLRWRRCRCVRR
jgi:hypothetical protein